MMIGDDGDVIVCMDEDNVYETIGGEIYSGYDGADSSRELNFKSIFHGCP
jgi:hypothetical protein